MIFFLLSQPENKRHQSVIFMFNSETIFVCPISYLLEFQSQTIRGEVLS